MTNQQRPSWKNIDKYVENMKHTLNEKESNKNWALWVGKQVRKYENDTLPQKYHSKIKKLMDAFLPVIDPNYLEKDFECVKNFVDDWDPSVDENLAYWVHTEYNKYINDTLSEEYIPQFEDLLNRIIKSHY